ncbi:glucose 1-dehydrogenase [Sphingopyxis sp. H115]|uniref:glucose 1-dehydrogenase n=1 Tax=Sphingopyxis sp. H115 TaxID=1759073 RepID=UPI000736672C|nr:glucose 1-dehydrogenase [Sphingopyxis sp. H115]KTE06371.1 short-chain dehydrogenase [Sphingopyxis sp. H115]
MALLTGKIAFVTGGGSGIGRATALAFAAEGARVAVADLNADGAAETAALVAAAGGEARHGALDVTDGAAVDTFVDALVADWGGLDCAFNNAGVALEGMETPWGDLDAYDRSIAVNQRGLLLCMAAELRHMERAGRGAIVNTASIAGMSGAGGAGYCGSKHAVIGLTRSAALRYAAQGIRINAVCPGAIRTPMVEAVAQEEEAARFIAAMHPMNRIGEAQEVADAVVFLCSDKASFITGHPLAVDGGYLAR